MALPMTKSPLALARSAYHAAKQALSPYSSHFSRKDFTQPQLFAILALKHFCRCDYRGVVQLLEDFSELRGALELRKVPHYSTLCYAAQRLVKKSPLTLSREPSFERLAG